MQSICSASHLKVKRFFLNCKSVNPKIHEISTFDRLWNSNLMLKTKITISLPTSKALTVPQHWMEFSFINIKRGFTRKLYYAQKKAVSQRFSQLSICNHINKFIIVYLAITVKISAFNKGINLGHVSRTTVFAEPSSQFITINLSWAICIIFGKGLKQLC